MSSTNRGNERNADDMYFTRWPCALAICEKLRDDGIVLDDALLLEPSCGKGAFVGAMHDVFRPKGLHALDVNEHLLLPEYNQLATLRITSRFEDYAPAAPAHRYDAVIGNPPYVHAEEHVRHAITLLKPEPHAVVCFLLRLNFMAGIERHGWSKKENKYTHGSFYEQHPPEYVYVLDKRPPFMEGNKTDSCEYGVFVWRSHVPEYETILRPLRWRNYLEHWEMAVEKKRKAAFGPTRGPENSPEDSEHRVRAAEDIRAVADTLRALTERHAWDD